MGQECVAHITPSECKGDNCALKRDCRELAYDTMNNSREFDEVRKVYFFFYKNLNISKKNLISLNSTFQAILLLYKSNHSKLSVIRKRTS